MGWISVADRLPKEKGYYLAYWVWANGTSYESQHIEVVYFRGKSHWAKHERYISHWMPLPKPPGQMTNADRIRTMTDEELSYFLCDFRTGSTGEHHCAGCKSEEYCRTGHNGMIEWLQQTAKED